MSSASRLVVVLGATLSLVGVVVACGSSDDSTFGDGSSSGGKFDPDGSFNRDGLADGGDPYANDLPPPYCPAPNTATCCSSPNPPKDPNVTGTVECPSDKNKPGCFCTEPGKQAPCWTGLRKNRGLGVCKDGVTTCKPVTETTYAWGECEGQVLPTPGATKGSAACGCFSQGQWKLANLSPCFIKYCTNNDCAQNAGTRTDTSKCQQPGQPGVACDATNGPCECSDANANNTGGGTNGTWALSTVMNGANSQCPTVGNTPPPAAAGSIWSTDTLKVDCAGHFKLCYELKSGDYANPQAGDCSLAKVCVEADYAQANVEQPFPDLGPWVTGSSACADKWSKTGGYGEMSVTGVSVACDKIDDGSGNAFVFNRVKYCPRKCENGANASDPACQGCQNGGSGQF